MLMSVVLIRPMDMAMDNLFMGVLMGMRPFLPLRMGMLVMQVQLVQVLMGYALMVVHVSMPLG